MSRMHRCALQFMVAFTAVAGDPRHIQNGFIIPDEGYCDQPYVVITQQGHWLCTMTTGPDEEGNIQQHVVATISEDRGKTWSPLIAIEPQGPPESSWVMPLMVPSGRIYAFYVYNGDNLREVITSTGKTKRVDTLGHYVFKYSDDGGRTWSAERYRIPIRTFEIDRENPYQGAVQFFWGVGKPFVHDGAAYIGMAKVGSFGKSFIERSEGFFLKSENILIESDPAKMVWETLPDGDIGLRAPQGPIAEEHNLTALSDGTLYCTYRTIEGHPCHAYSRDGGHSWTPPAYMTYRPGGRAVRHPRAANFVRRISNGKYLYWFHNHGGTTYEGRNPVWISGGIEKDGAIHWSQPEILLYDDDPKLRMSYPDFIEVGGETFVTETQKSVARVHAIPKSILEAVWGQFDRSEVARDGLIMDREAAPFASDPSVVDIADVQPDVTDSGVSLDVWLSVDELPVADVRVVSGALDNFADFALYLRPDGGFRFALEQGASAQDIATESSLINAGRHHVSVILEAGPRLALFVVDGALADGGSELLQGWHRVSEQIAVPNRGVSITCAPSSGVKVERIRFYTRPLLVSEAVGNYRAGR